MKFKHRVYCILDRYFDRYLNREITISQIEKCIDAYLYRDLSKVVISDHLKNNEELRKTIWKTAHVRPSGLDYFYSSIPNSIRERRMEEASLDTAKFVTKNIPHIEGNENPYQTLEQAIEAAMIDGLYLEFGVFSGTTINQIADLVPNKTVHGFDSFEGLPEGWGAAKKGTFDTGGKFPQVRDNVKLHKGWFENTIAPFINDHQGAIAFLHCDADLYSSTKTILDGLRDRIVSGTIIVFDEYFNYPFWRDHEYKAFNEFIDSTDFKFEYIAFTDKGYSAAVKIITGEL